MKAWQLLWQVLNDAVEEDTLYTLVEPASEEEKAEKVRTGAAAAAAVRRSVLHHVHTHMLRDHPAAPHVDTSARPRVVRCRFVLGAVCIEHRAHANRNQR